MTLYNIQYIVMKKRIIEIIAYIWNHKTILFLCIFIYSITLVRIMPDGGMGCVNKSCGLIIGESIRDSTWFMSMAAISFKTFPFQLPIFSGASLQGYYYLPALCVYIISRLGIPILLFYYKIFPILYLLCMTAILVVLGRSVKDSPLYVFLIIFFVLLGIPLTILLSLMHNMLFTNRLIIDTFQASNIFDSFPTAYSYLLFFPGLFISLTKKKGFKDYIFISIILFLLFGTKFYTAFLYLSIVSIMEVIEVLKKAQSVKNTLFHLGLYMLFIVASIFLFLDPIHTTSGAPMFVFSPFATVHHLIEEPSLFYIKNMVLARYYLYQFGMTPRLLGIELFSTLLFVVFYFGIRVIGFIYLAKKYVLKRASTFEVAVGISIFISVAISVLFVQRGDWFNPMQFAVGPAHLLSIYAALFCYDIFKWNKAFFYGVFFIVLVCIIPSNLTNLTYLNSPSRSVISYPEVEALNFLKAQKDGVVFLPVEGADAPYIPLLTGKVLYYNLVNQLVNFGIDTSKRQADLADFKKIKVDNLKIRYVYLPTRYNAFIILNKKFTQSKSYKIIFKNTDIVIFKKI